MNPKSRQSRAERRTQRPTWLPEPRPPHLVLDEVGGTAGYVLWMLLNDCGLWIGAAARAELFEPGGRDWAREGWPAELVDAFSVLRAASAAPELARAPDLAGAAASVWEWAEREGHHETGVQFAELAARLEPGSPARAVPAGRLCRRRGLRVRAAQWFQRATRLARLRNDEIGFATALLGWSVLELNQGNYLQAEAHLTRAYRASMRAGRRSLAGAAKHDLFALAATSGRCDEALVHLRDAARLYATHHPRLPMFAHDAAFLLNRLGHFSGALRVMERVMPLVQQVPERILGCATVARAAGAVRDRARFEAAAGEVLALSAADSEMVASSLAHVGQGARCFGEWDRAAGLAREALRRAEAWDDKTAAALAAELLRAVEAREPGDVEAVPPAGAEVEQIVAALLRRLERHTAPRDRRAVPPEKFPVY